MAYNGYLIKINGVIIPLDYMRADTYKAQVNSSDLDSYTDANGFLHRNVLDHPSNKVEWNTITMHQRDMQAYLGILRSIYGEKRERKAMCEIYVPEWDRYHTGQFYMPDYQFTMRWASDTDILYEECRFALIEY